MIFSAAQIVAHLVGDYLLQSDSMALRKRTRFSYALFHALVYSVPFLFFRPSIAAWLVIVGTHAWIDHLGLARYVVWAKNFLAPREDWPPPFARCAATGYPDSKPAYLAVWLTIIADNTLHLLCNALALSAL